LTTPRPSSDPARSDPVSTLRRRLRETPLLDGWRFVSSLAGAVRWRSALRDARTYCLFIGHGRSGHSIVGSLLDAHPEAIVSDELDALRYIELGFLRDQVLALSIARSAAWRRGERRKLGRGGQTYSYLVPGWWNGRFERLRVVGDTRAGGSVHRLAAQPALLEQVDQRMRGLSVRYVHVVRNPYDNISTMTIRRGRTLDDAIAAYLADCQSLVTIRERIGSTRLHDLRHEDLIADPRARLAELCRFLDLSVPDGYLDACAGILFASPSRSRDNVDWSADRIQRVREGIERFDFLAGYSYDA
jgi:hypothetical protein